MPEVTKDGSEKSIDIHVRVVRNGVVLEGMDDSGESYEYVYPSLDKALKEISGLISVLQEGTRKTTKEDLDAEEEKINKSQEKEEE